MIFSTLAHPLDLNSAESSTLVFSDLSNKVKHSSTYSCNTMCLSIQIFSPVAFLHVFLWLFDSYLSFPTRYKFLAKRILGFAHQYIHVIWDIVAYLVYWFINSEWVPLLPPYSCQQVIRPILELLRMWTSQFLQAVHYTFKILLKVKNVNLNCRIELKWTSTHWI